MDEHIGGDLAGKALPCPIQLPTHKIERTEREGGGWVREQHEEGEGLAVRCGVKMNTHIDPQNGTHRRFLLSPHCT